MVIFWFIQCVNLYVFQIYAVPEELAKKHKRPLWTDRSMVKSKTFDKDEMKDDFNSNAKLNGIANIKPRGVPKKRESLL